MAQLYDVIQLAAYGSLLLVIARTIRAAWRKLCALSKLRFAYHAMPTGRRLEITWS